MPGHDKSKDELQRLLQEALKKKRPRWLRVALATILLVLGTLALLAWLLAPKGEPADTTVVAFDDVAAADTEVITLQGRLDAPADARAALEGKDMVFVDGQVLLAAGQEPRQAAAKTGPQGEASCPWTFSPETIQGDFILRQIADKFRPGMEDRGRVFFSPRATPLCLVQIDETLTPSKPEAWRKQKIQDIAPAPGAAQALGQAREKGYEIVYLAVAAEQPMVYQKMRAWLSDRSAAGAVPIPAGAVLGRFTLPRADQDDKPWRKTAERLRKIFVLPEGERISKHLAIAGTSDAARQFHAAGLRTLYLGPAQELPAGIERLAGWEEVRRGLEK